jgi:hypothetical protein
MTSNIPSGKHNRHDQNHFDGTDCQVRRRAPRVGLRGGRGRSYPLAERLAARTVPGENGCQNIQGCKVGPNGYGQIMRDSKSRKLAYAHIVAWELAFGVIPTGQKVLHRCDNPRCVNASHLFLGTQADNVQDSIRKGRHQQWRETGLRLNGEPAKGSARHVVLPVHDLTVAPSFSSPQRNSSARLRLRSESAVTA